MKNKLFILTLAALTLAGCGESPSPAASSQSSSSIQTQSSSSQSQSSSSSISKSVSAQEKFIKAKNKTFENDIYQYKYTLEAKIKFSGAVSFSPATFSGTVQYNKNGGETTYLHEQNATGILVFDYTTYTYNVGNDLIKVNANEEKDFSVVTNEEVPVGYDFETNSVGVVLKSLADNGNLKVTQDGSKYNLALTTNFASDSFLKILNKIDSKKILDTLNKYTQEKWDSGLTVNCYATLNSTEEYVDSFHFDINVDIADVCNIILTFDQKFDKVGSDVAISLPVFSNTLTKENDIDNEMTLLKSSLAESKKSYYSYRLKTGVDHGPSKGNPLGLAVNSDSRGYAERQIVGDKVYFHNGLELDSDYKNSDQYPDEIDDYKYTRAKVNDGEDSVYDVYDGALKNSYYKVENYDNDAIDDYYMMIDSKWLSHDYIKIMRKTQDDNNYVYRLGISGDGIKDVLKTYNKSIRLDKDLTKWIDVYDIESGFEAKKSEFEITVDNNNKITDVSFEAKGFYNMTGASQVKFDFNLKLIFDYDHDAYVAPTEYKKISLPNYNVID